MLESNKWPLFPQGLEGKARGFKLQRECNSKTSRKQQSVHVVSQEGARILVGQKRALFQRATLGQRNIWQLISLYWAFAAPNIQHEPAHVHYTYSGVPLNVEWGLPK